MTRLITPTARWMLPACSWIALATFAFAAGPGATVITFKVVKQSSGMCRTTPELKLLEPAGPWTVRPGQTWEGENLREIFFTVETTDPQAALPRVAVTAPGIVPQRVIVGKQDVPFEHQGDTVTLTLVRDTRNAMLLSQILPDSEGGLPIHIYHNWMIRQDGPFHGKPAPQVEVKAVLNYLVAAREALKLLAASDPDAARSFDGRITLMSFEVACARAHNDYPPHVHIMLWVPGYVGGEVPHFYMDARGRIVRNGFGILADAAGKFPDRAAIIAEKQKRSGEYGPGKPCRLCDLQNRLALELTITPEGGLLLAQGSGEPCLLIGDQRGPDDAVVVKRAGQIVLRARVADDAERGETQVTVEHVATGAVVRTVRQTLLYDPFTGLGRTDASPAPAR